DAWGNRYTYRIRGEFARTVPQTTFASCAAPPPSNPALAAFALCSQGDITILNAGGGSTLASAIPVVVISHGNNGNGAYYPQGTQLPLGTDADEQDNQLTAAGTATANTNFVSKTPTATFDDIVIWLSPNILFNRMVAAGRLP
ncbi:MAG: prepilin-type cleavage/methylation domain-containing protein, partial [Sulfurimicrobium sp.]|nr:prepilin-type cleavage/methylation domain-containing protein [Sulfurimicrobium sp.]